MNQYLKEINKLEFVVTSACLGKCKHCSQGDHIGPFLYLDANFAKNAIEKIAESYDIKTVMAFGGEPLLKADSVYTIMQTAKEKNIQKRQVITSGFFTKNADEMKRVCDLLSDSGVNDLLLSVDACHQENIPLKYVKEFAFLLKEKKIPTRLQPAWLVKETDENKYNQKTREILNSFSDLNFPIGEGNVVFCEGNAKKYLSEYFSVDLPINPYEEDPYHVTCLSFSPDGEILGENMYEKNIEEILENYSPKK